MSINNIIFQWVCRCVAVLLHFLFLAVFSLMLAEGLHLYRKLYRALNGEDGCSMLLVLGWGMLNIFYILFYFPIYQFIVNFMFNIILIRLLKHFIC